MSNVPLKPLGDRIVAEREESEARTAAGLFLPEDAKEKSQVATVLATGKDVKDVNVGDRIVVREYSTTEIKVNNKKYFIVKEEDVLATLA